MWDLIVSVPDHCLSFYFTIKKIFGGILPSEGEKMQKCIPAPLSFRNLPIVCGCQDKQ